MDAVKTSSQMESRRRGESTLYHGGHLDRNDFKKKFEATGKMAGVEATFNTKIDIAADVLGFKFNGATGIKLVNENLYLWRSKSS